MAKLRKNVFEELDKAKNLLLIRFPDFDIRNLCPILSRLATYHYNKRKVMLLGQEREFYNLLIENSYNPFTVYRWALLEKVPDEIKFQLRHHYVSQKNASKQHFQQRHETDTDIQISLRDAGLRIIREM